MKKGMFFCLIATCIMCSIGPVEAQTITSSQSGTHDGYYYMFWNEGGGEVSMTLGPGGNYSTVWSNCGNFVCGKGWNPGSSDKIVHFYGNFNGGINGFLSLYGWTKNPLIEYYVVENYGTWTPPGVTSAGTFASDGGIYNLYRLERQNQLSIEGITSFFTYWSVRTSKRSSGTITFENHINAWASHGWDMGSNWVYQLMTTEGYNSSGNSNVTIGGIVTTTTSSSSTTTTSSGTTTTTSSSSTTTSPSSTTTSSDSMVTLVLRARGTSGQEQVYLKIGNTIIKTWTLSTSMQNYSVSTYNKGGISLQFFNDASGRDVQVDYLQVNGSIRQAEAQVYNTAVWQYNKCGGWYSEWMHCNGIIGFGNTP